MLHHLPPYGLFEVPIFNVFFSDKGGPFLIFLIQVALFWGNNDWLCDERDLMKIVGQVFQSLQTLQCIVVKNQETMIVSDIDQVPNIVVNNQVPWDGWNHLDFLYAIDIDQYQNDDLLAALAMYPIE